MRSPNVFFGRPTVNLYSCRYVFASQAMLTYSQSVRNKPRSDMRIRRMSTGRDCNVIRPYVRWLAIDFTKIRKATNGHIHFTHHAHTLSPSHSSGALKKRTLHSAMLACQTFIAFLVFEIEKSIYCTTQRPPKTKTHHFLLVTFGNIKSKFQMCGHRHHFSHR